MPLAADFYWCTRSAPEDDLRRLLRGFETKAEVEERSERLCRTLEKGNRKHRQLAKRLRRCGKGRRCCLVPCPRCRRRYRLWLVGEMLIPAGGSPDGCCALWSGGSATAAPIRQELERPV
jgi:hypothetical protein